MSGKHQRDSQKPVGPSGFSRSVTAVSSDGRLGVLRGRCVPCGDGIAYLLIMEVAREAAGIEPTG
jgi:hypothetical protein